MIPATVVVAATKVNSGCVSPNGGRGGNGTATDGRPVGWLVGLSDGRDVGLCVGCVVGHLLGCVVGWPVGSSVGCPDGAVGVLVG